MGLLPFYLLYPSSRWALIQAVGCTGTFAGSMAVVLPPNYVVEARIDQAGNMSLAVEGIFINAEKAQAFRKGQITYEPFVPDLGQQLTVEVAPFKVSILAVKAYTDKETGCNRAHLDLRAEASSLPLIKPHGILGQCHKYAFFEGVCSYHRLWRALELG